MASVPRFQLYFEAEKGTITPSRSARKPGGHWFILNLVGSGCYYRFINIAFSIGRRPVFGQFTEEITLGPFSYPTLLDKTKDKIIVDFIFEECRIGTIPEKMVDEFMFDPSIIHHGEYFTVRRKINPLYDNKKRLVNHIYHLCFGGM